MFQTVRVKREINVTSRCVFTDDFRALKACIGAEQCVEDRVKRFPCPQCNCSFSMRTNLRRHVKKAHCQPLWRPIAPVIG